MALPEAQRRRRRGGEEESEEKSGELDVRLDGLWIGHVHPRAEKVQGETHRLLFCFFVSDLFCFDRFTA